VRTTYLRATSIFSSFLSLYSYPLDLPSFPTRRSSDLWYRYAPSYVSPAYHLLEGFPFIQEPPSGDLQERVLIRHHDYDQKAVPEIGRAVQQECRDRSRMPSSA